MLSHTHVLLLVPLLCWGDYFESSLHTNNGTININHHADNTSVHVQYNNLHRKYPSVNVLRRLHTYNRRATTTIPIQTTTTKRRLLNVSHPYFLTQVHDTYDELQLCRKLYRDLEIRLLDVNTRFMEDLMSCENNVKLHSDSRDCNETAENLRILLNNTTNEILELRSDLTACVTNTEGLEFERDKYIAKYVEASRLPKAERLTSSISTLPPPIISNTTNKVLLNLQWQYSSCMQELSRTKNKLFICKNTAVPN